jgi:hypothetical protein
MKYRQVTTQERYILATVRKQGLTGPRSPVLPATAVPSVASSSATVPAGAGITV